MKFASWIAFCQSFFDGGVLADTAEQAKKLAKRTDEPLWLGEHGHGKNFYVFYAR